MERDRAHEWSGWMISNRIDSCHRLYHEHNLQAPSKIFYAKIFIPCDHIIFHDDLRTFRQKLRQLHVVQVATAKSTNRIFANWTRNSANSCAPMRVLTRFLTSGFACVLECTAQAGVKLWSRRCLEQHWKLANYIAKLPDNRWPNPFLRKINLAKGCIRPNESCSNMT